MDLDWAELGLSFRSLGDGLVGILAEFVVVSTESE